MGWKAIRLMRLAGVALVTAVMLTMATGALAQSANDAATIFNGLPPDQQQAILDKIGGQSGSARGLGQQNGTQTNSPRGTQRSGKAVDRNPDRKDDASARDDAMSSLLPPRLKAGDTVLVTASIRREPIPNTGGAAAIAPAAGANAANAANGAAGGTVPALVAQPDREVELTVTQKARLQSLIEQIGQRNPYVLDRNGALLLPGFDAIPLAGLNSEEAGLRISADPALPDLTVKLTLLPLLKSGIAALKPFGYDLFSGANSTFAPVTDIPVPADYIVGAGDVLDIQLYGSQNRSLSLTVSRDGRIAFPQLGPIEVGGRRFSEVRADIQQRVSRQMIGVNAALSMGDMRSIQVFVLGEVEAPGAYTVSGLSTITSALFASGGVKPIGSLRTIQLKRQGALVRTLDLYDLLLRGDSSNDVKLQAGDVVFIPAVGPTASVDGEVKRPAIYELRGTVTAADLISMAGGLTSEADATLGSLTHVDEQRRRVVIGVDLDAGAERVSVGNGDVLRIARLRPTVDSGVVVQGHVFRPGNFAWRSGLRLSQVIASVDELKPDADQHYVLIRRELAPDRRIAVLSADLAAAWRAPGSEADVLLEPHDQLTVFDLSSDRERVIAPLMNELKVQGGFDHPTEHVSINGRVKVPGDYPLETHMHIADLVRAGGSLDAAAYGGNAELSRYVLEGGRTRRTQVIDVDLAAVLRGDANANLVLQPFDTLYIKEVSGWSQQEQVVLKGEVRFPGTYAIQRGESLRSVIARAGGLTELASHDGSIFTREELKTREQEQLDRLAGRLQSDLISMSLMAARANQSGAQQTYSVGQSLLAELKAAKAVGRLVINLDASMAATPGSANDIALRDGDELLVPKRSQEVTVMGEVQNVTSHLYRSNLDRDEYINLSGGPTRQADRRHIYVVRANGSVVADNARWFSRSRDIRPGDTIVVPLNTDRLPALSLWQSVTQILYNVAIATAAVNSL